MNLISFSEHIEKFNLTGVQWQATDRYIFVPKHVPIQLVDEVTITVEKNISYARDKNQPNISFLPGKNAITTRDFTVPRLTYVAVYGTSFLVKFPDSDKGFLIYQSNLFFVDV